MMAASLCGIRFCLGILVVAASALVAAQAAAGEPKLPSDDPPAIRLFNCDFFGYAWGTPPSFLPTAMYDEELKVVKAAFAEIEKLDAAHLTGSRQQTLHP
jgi:hypothetical protein